MAQQVGDVVKRLTSQGFGDVLRRRSVGPKDNDACVVVFHGQAAVVLGALDLANILPFYDERPGDVSGARKRPLLELRDLARVDDDCGPISGEDMPDPASSIAQTPPAARQVGMPSW